MLYTQKDSIPELSRFIKKFWMVNSIDESIIKREKIVPDGYPEIIFHYKEPYIANFHDSWEKQAKQLIVGQIKNYFYVENTGCSGIFGIKFQPSALKILFGINMHTLTDKVVSLDSYDIKIFNDLIQFLGKGEPSFDEMILKAENLLLEYLISKNYHISQSEKTIQILHDKKGAINLTDLYELAEINERGLERFFRNYIGLTPKYYTRIIRFSHIFQLVQKHQKDWQEIIFLAGFYDQSHFIKNFKEFTGEDPSKYKFSEHNLSNFFLSE